MSDKELVEKLKVLSAHMRLLEVVRVHLYALDLLREVEAALNSKRPFIGYRALNAARRLVATTQDAVCRYKYGDAHADRYRTSV